MPRLVNRNPKYCHHRASGRAYVTLDGRDIYLGTYGSTDSKAEYSRVVGEWLANGRRPPSAVEVLSVAELILRFKDHAEKHYRHPDGTPTGETVNFQHACRPLRKLYGPTPAATFGPLALETVRNEMIRMGWCRTNVNRQVNRIRQVFRWGVSRELFPVAVADALATLAPLQRGRCEARESAPVKSVPDAVVDATLKHLPRQVAAMVELQRLTGMRPGEVVTMRGCEIDRSKKVWAYRPGQHKTSHHGHERIVFLGPKAQVVLAPLLDRKPDVQAPLFSPAEAEAERRAALHATRKTPSSCGNCPGSNVKRKPKKAPGAAYSVASYSFAIVRGCMKAFGMPDELRKAKKGETLEEKRLRLDKAIAWREANTWHPHQLRHSAGTRLRRQFKSDVAQVALGHATQRSTEKYAEPDVEAARQIMGRVG